MSIDSSSRKPRRTLVIFGIIAMLLILPGCRLVYLFKVATSEFELLNGAIPIDDALKSDSLGENLKAHLSLVKKAKRFGETELGLKETANYSTVNLDPNQGRFYALSAAYKDRLAPVTWWFPVIGNLPYIGFFDLESARAEQRKLIEMDLDTVLGRVDAYSTLGWFKDPLTLSLIESSTVDLVETVLHEMTHSTLYLKGQGEFNEGLATLVGKQGSYLFMKETFGPDHPLTLEAQKSIEEERVFSSFLIPLLKELNQVYDSSLAYQEKLREREKIFALALERLRSLGSRSETPRFARLAQGPLNNAVLVSLAVYHGHYPLFERALKQSGDSIPKMLGTLRTISREGENMMVSMRAWLDKNEASSSPITIRLLF